MDEPESLGAISLAGAREARRPHLGRQLQPAAARRTGARQRQDHSGTRRRIRGAGWNVIKVIWGSQLGSAAGERIRAAPRAADDRMRRRRLSDVQVAQRQVRARRVLRALSRDEGAGRVVERRRRSGMLQRGGHDPVKVYAAYKAAFEHRGAADGRAREDDQGLRHGRGRRGPEHRAPGQEDGSRGDARIFRDRFSIPITDEKIGDKMPFLQAARRRRTT